LHALYALGATFAMVIAAYIGRRIMARLRAGIERRYRARIQGIQERAFQLVKAEQVWRALTSLLNFAWAAGFLIIIYFYLQYVLALFPWTRALARRLFAIAIDPLRTMGLGLVGLIPNLVFLAILTLVTRYVLKLIRLFFEGVAGGTVTLRGWDPEWAIPTYRLVRVLVIAFAVVVAYPYVPGSGSEAFKGVSLLVGIIFSLGSSSLIGNFIAGYSMTYRRAFRIGDRVKIGDHVGDVERMRLLVTHLRTPKNEEVVVPNSTILGSEVVNYSSMARERGLILHTTVGIGYETPWRQVEAMLLEAAGRTQGLRREPAPFVLQKTLGDFCVTYEINAYCDTPHAMLELYTALHQNILDLFNEHGVQIMTPAYECDPDQPKVVPKEQWYAAPARPPEGIGGGAIRCSGSTGTGIRDSGTVGRQP
jgi:small-conductance mechanosensitive channel